MSVLQYSDEPQSEFVVHVEPIKSSEIQVCTPPTVFNVCPSSHKLLEPVPEYLELELLLSNKEHPTIKVEQDVVINKKYFKSFIQRTST